MRGSKHREIRRGQDNPRQEGILFCNLREPKLPRGGGVEGSLTATEEVEAFIFVFP